MSNGKQVYVGELWLVHSSSGGNGGGITLQEAIVLEIYSRGCRCYLIRDRKEIEFRSTAKLRRLLWSAVR